MSGIYLHIPFCRKACHYCNFHFSTSKKYVQEVVDALTHELAIRQGELKQAVETIYFGGGTPSMLTSAQISVLIAAVYDNYNVLPEPEITIEVNPDDITQS